MPSSPYEDIFKKPVKLNKRLKGWLANEDDLPNNQSYTTKYQNNVIKNQPTLDIQPATTDHSQPLNNVKCHEPSITGQYPNNPAGGKPLNFTNLFKHLNSNNSNISSSHEPSGWKNKSHINNQC